ncbi:MAG: hypothetical protein Roseis2KO_15730 [Roseivirga sp.]
MKKVFIKSFFLFSIMFAFISCETLELESLIENPNALGLSSADPNFILNTMQLNLRDQSEDMSGTVDQAVRLSVTGATYNAQAGITVLNGEWTRLYGFNQDFITLETLAEGNDDLGFHLGMAQIMKAAMFVYMVDLTDGAVFSEANNPDIRNPGLDSGEDIYTAMYALLDEGIQTLENTSGPAPTNDLFFDGNKANWIKFANSFKLKMRLTTRLVTAAESTSAINALIADGNFIDSNSEDMEFRYGVSGPPFESRHPFYTANYITGGANYMPNFLMAYMRDSSAVEDPRMKYYFYRQTTRDPSNASELPCAGDARYFFCNIGEGYWGRDHGDPNSIPNDRNLRTVFGVYPAAGAFDDQFADVVDSDNLGGNGIHPIMLSSWVQFMLAEAALTLGTSGDAATYLENGIRQHIAKVISFYPAGNPGSADVDAYVADVLADYAAADPAGKLDIITREWYISSWGNATEPFNTYRRTGFPSFIVDPVFDLGPIMRSFLYPENERTTNTNPNFEQRSTQDQVFWDNNPAGFIN